MALKPLLNGEKTMPEGRLKGAGVFAADCAEITEDRYAAALITAPFLTPAVPRPQIRAGFWIVPGNPKSE
jgi:hypothetical protein